MTAEEYLLIIAPEFDGVDVTGAIEIAEVRVAAGFCGDKRDLIVAYLAAHILAMAGRKSNIDGGIKSLSEGGLSISYASADNDVNNNYTSTPYGREYETLVKSCIFTPRTGRSVGY